MTSTGKTRPGTLLKIGLADVEFPGPNMFKRVVEPQYGELRRNVLAQISA